MWGPLKKLLGRIVCLILIVLSGLLFFYLRGIHQVRQVRFNLAAVHRYIQANRAINGPQITSLENLPDFHIISEPEGLSLKGEQMRKRLLGGYVYDMQSLEEGRYVISASPVGFANPGLEFAILETGTVWKNDVAVDPIEDTYSEVSRWKQISSQEVLRSAKLPEYLRD